VSLCLVLSVCVESANAQTRSLQHIYDTYTDRAHAARRAAHVHVVCVYLFALDTARTALLYGRLRAYVVCVCVPCSVLSGAPRPRPPPSRWPPRRPGPRLAAPAQARGDGTGPHTVSLFAARLAPRYETAGATTNSHTRGDCGGGLGSVTTALSPPKFELPKKPTGGSSLKVAAMERSAGAHLPPPRLVV
jgi:hypothetical protein